jgi:hypothetical protein
MTTSAFGRVPPVGIASESHRNRVRPRATGRNRIGIASESHRNRIGIAFGRVPPVGIASESHRNRIGIAW